MNIFKFYLTIRSRIKAKIVECENTIMLYSKEKLDATNEKDNYSIRYWQSLIDDVKKRSKMLKELL